MSYSNEAGVEEKRLHVANTLAWLGFDKYKILREVDGISDLSIPDYLDRKLIREIPVLHQAKLKANWAESPEERRFRFILSLCFNGDLSQEAWDKVWGLLNQDQQILYTTVTDRPALVDAAVYGNLDGLKRLDTIYERLIGKYSERLYGLHYQLRVALLEVGKVRPRLNICEHVKIYDFLLGLCTKYATSKNPDSSSVGLANKQFASCGKGAFPTPLLNIFAEICEQYFDNKQAWAIKRLSDYIRASGNAEDFEQFRNALLPLVENKKLASYKDCWKALGYDEEFLFALKQDPVDQSFEEFYSCLKSRLIKGVDTETHPPAPADHEDVPLPNDSEAVSGNGDQAREIPECTPSSTGDSDTEFHDGAPETEKNVSPPEDGGVKPREEIAEIQENVMLPKDNGADLHNKATEIGEDVRIPSDEVDPLVAAVPTKDDSAESACKDISQDAADDNERKKIYLQAYEDQEFRHTWRRYVGKVFAVIAAVLPPLSLVFTINSLSNEADRKPWWRKITEGFLFAVLPIASGVYSWHQVNRAEAIRRQQDDIQKQAINPQEEQARRNKKTELNISWNLLKEESKRVAKPKKIKTEQDVYMDRAQKWRRDSLLSDNDKLTTATFFGSYQESYGQSKAIIDNLQKKYRC